MKIPVGNFGQQIAQPGPRPDIPRGAFVDGTAQGMAAGGEKLASIGMQLLNQQREQEDLANTMGAEKKLADWSMGALFDPQKGAFATKGKAAMGITTPTVEAFDRQVEDISQGLTSQSQKATFQRIAMSRRMQLQGQLATHEQQESQTYAKGELNGLMQTSINSAALQFNDPEAVRKETSRAVGALTAFAHGHGWSQEQLDAAIQKQRSDVLSAVAERMIQADPSRGFSFVQKNMDQFDAADGTRLMNVATNTMESRQRLALANEARADRIREKQDKLRAQNAAKAGDLLWTQGALTPEWIEQNRNTLDPSDYRYFQNKILDGSPERTDPMVYTNLRDRLANGDDISDDARAALRLGLLKTDDFNRLSTIQEKGSQAGEVPSAYKRGVGYIRGALRVSDLNPDPAAAQRQASALNDWDDWIQANPNASDSDAQQTYQRIVHDYQLTDAMDSSLVKPMPSYAVGNRRDMDVDATAQATVQAFLDKHGGDRDAALADPEFQRQATLIEQWRPIIDRQRAQRAADQGKRNDRR
jgi:hypothetical protein